MPQRLILLYHFFHPDDVISARLYSELGQAFATEGWDVVALPANRSCHEAQQRLPKKERWGEVLIRRVTRPAFSQSRLVGRLLNTAFMLIGWTWFAVWNKRSEDEVVVVGTDPVFGILAVLPWKLFRPRCRIIHWCHDVHPEASIADGANPQVLHIRFLRWLLRIAYRKCDLIVDLGPCMRAVLSNAAKVELIEPDAVGQPSTSERTQIRLAARTITPWSLVEPAAPVPMDLSVRKDLFGDANLGLLYSGNLGRAHEYKLFIRLAQLCSSGDASAHAAFCFAGRGAGLSSLKSLLHDAPQENISLAGFASEAILEKRLGACDIHLVSLKPEWTGTVVPSKFFGALAIGRPVLFVGSPDSSIAQWIAKYDVGWTLCEHNLQDLADRIRAIAADRSQLVEINQRCWRTYQDHFSQKTQLERWHVVLNKTHETDA